MKRLDEYRVAALTYLKSRVQYFDDNIDAFLDTALRSISNLADKPKGDDNYNGLLGMKPVMDQRLLCLKLLSERLSVTSFITETDFLIDTSIRLLNKLPARPNGKDPYSSLFKLPEQKEEENKDVTDYKVSQEGINLIHSFESYRRCTYKDPGSSNGLPITG